MACILCPGCGGDGALVQKDIWWATCLVCFGAGKVQVQGCTACHGQRLWVQRQPDGTHVLAKCGTCKGTGRPREAT